MSMSEVELTCECGAKMRARFQDAGGQLNCDCGQSLSVPPLSKLRQLAGQDAYTTNAVEAIQKQLNQGQIPAGLDCLICNAVNCQQHDFIAVCESTYTKGTDSAAANDIPSLMSKLFLIFAAPRLLVFWLLKRSDEIEVEQFGRDTSVEVALPVCDSCVSSGHNPKSVKTAKKLMRQVALYDRLLEEYPTLKLERR